MPAFSFLFPLVLAYQAKSVGVLSNIERGYISIDASQARMVGEGGIAVFRQLDGGRDTHAFKDQMDTANVAMR
jgi:hypothetical protein